MKLQKPCLIAGALFGVTGVSLGAWGAHGLAAYLGSTDTGAWDTAVLYQLVHALGLLAIGALLQGPGNARLLGWSGLLMMLGIYTGKCRAKCNIVLNFRPVCNNISE